MLNEQRQNLRWFGVFPVLVALLTRVAVIGQAPHADEGHYAAASYFQFLGYTKGLFAQTMVIPQYGGLELNSLLFSWLYFLPGEPLILFRVVDSVWASLAGLAMFMFLAQLTRNRTAACIATVIVILAMNHPAIIEAGARNSIPAAMACFFAAAYLLERERGQSVVLPGLLLGFAVLVREPFFPFVGVLLLYSWQQYGLGRAFRLATVCAGLATIVFLAIAVLKGGVSGAEAIVDAYRSFPYSNQHFNSFAEKLLRVRSQGVATMQDLIYCLPILSFGIIAVVFPSVRRAPAFIRGYWLGIALMCATLVEVFIKTPYGYHFAQILIGGSIVMALGLQVLIHWSVTLWQVYSTRMLTLSIVLLLGQLALMADLANTLRYAVGWSLHFSPVTIQGDWSSAVVNESYYLKIAALVRQNTKPGDVILSTVPNIYPLTSTIPVTRETASLSMYSLTHGTDQLDSSTTSLIRVIRPRIFVQEYPTVSRANEQVYLPIPAQYQDLFGRSVRVGPGLSPYRAKVALVHFSEQIPSPQAP